MLQGQLLQYGNKQSVDMGGFFNFFTTCKIPSPSKYQKSINVYSIARMGSSLPLGENSEERENFLFHTEKKQAQVPTRHFSSTNEIPIGFLTAHSTIKLFPWKPCRNEVRKQLQCAFSTSFTWHMTLR